jgi:hypothetical protein
MVDVETSGPVPGLFSLLSLGAVIVGQHIPPFHQHFYAEFKPLPDAGVEEEAMRINKMDIERLKREGEDPRAALLRFMNWVIRMANPLVVHPVMVSDGTYDFMWVRWYYANFHVPNPFQTNENPSGNSLDMKSFVMGLKPGLRWPLTRHSLLVSRFPEFKSEYPHAHNALDDAIEQADRFQKMRGL